MDQIPPDEEDTPEVHGSFASLVAKTRRSNDFFQSRRALGSSSSHPQVTQMTQEDDIQEDSSSDESVELAPIRKKIRRNHLHQPPIPQEHSKVLPHLQQSKTQIMVNG